MQGILRLFQPRHIVNVVNNAGVRVQSYSGTSDNPPEPYLQIPLYPVNKPQPLEQRKARLVYQSRKRGMLENDLILSTFVKQHLHTMNEGQVLLYDHLINSPSNDWDLFYWITEKKPTPEEFDSEVMDMLKYHAKNTKKESLRQPKLHE